MVKQISTRVCYLGATALALLVFPVSRPEGSAFADASGRAGGETVVPDKAVQSALQALLSSDSTQMFSGTLETLRARLDQLRRMAGHDEELVLQLLYYQTHAKNEREAMLSSVIIEQLAISNEIFVAAGLPLLDSNDESTRRLGFEVLTRADHGPGGGVDFTRYEGILREQGQNPPQGLIRYMYYRDPRAAVIAVARGCGQGGSEVELAAKATGNVKEAVEYFVGRPEWWAHLYVVAMMEKEPYLQTPDVMKRLQNDRNPLVREVLARLPVSMEATSKIWEPGPSAKTIKTFELHIPFENDKAVLVADVHPQLDEIAKLLKTNPKYIIKIEGHTDKTKRSNAGYSQKLTEQRARAVLDYLAKSNGIDMARMTAVGVGFASPKAPNNPDSGNLENRRIEVYIYENL